MTEANPPAQPAYPRILELVGIVRSVVTPVPFPAHAAKSLDLGSGEVPSKRRGYLNEEKGVVKYYSVDILDGDRGYVIVNRQDGDVRIWLFDLDANLIRAAYGTRSAPFKKVALTENKELLDWTIDFLLEHSQPEKAEGTPDRSSSAPDKK